MTNVYLDIFIGNRDENRKLQAEYDTTCDWLSKNAKIYGLPTSPTELSDEQRNIMHDLGDVFLAAHK